MYNLGEGKIVICRKDFIARGVGAGLDQPVKERHISGSVKTDPYNIRHKHLPYKLQFIILPLFFHFGLFL